MKSSDTPMDEVKVTFRFVGDNVNPKTITAKIGIQPSAAHAKGDKVEKHPSHNYPSGFWELESSIPTDRSLEEHLKHLLDILEPRASVIRELKKIGLSPNFYCGVFTDADFGTSVKLETNTLARMAGIEVSLELHLYCCNER